jgi:hypothetical protein
VTRSTAIEIAEVLSDFALPCTQEADMLSRLESQNREDVERKESELLCGGLCQGVPNDYPEPREYRKFSYDSGRSIIYVIEWEDEVLVGSSVSR